MSLSEQQQKFVDEYIKNPNATQAAIKAGYAESSARVTASRLLAKDNIKSAIQKQLDLMHKERIADAAEVMEFISATMRGETKSEELTNTGKVVDITPSIAQRLKAAELMGKRHALFTDNVNMKSNANIEIDIGDYKDVNDESKSEL